MNRNHTAVCEWHLDQYPWECTCGLTAPKSDWHDSSLKEYSQRMKSREISSRPLNSDAKTPT